MGKNEKKKKLNQTQIDIWGLIDYAWGKGASSVNEKITKKWL